MLFFKVFLKHGGGTRFILDAKLITGIKLGYYKIIFLQILDYGRKMLFFYSFLNHGGGTRSILDAKLIIKLVYYQFIFLLKNGIILIN